jgi:hypothetical protein
MNLKPIEKWSYGLGAAFIGGGAGAVTATVTASLIAPDQFNLSNQLSHFIELASVTFFVNGFLNAMNFLKQSPLPPELPDDPKPL